MMSGFYTLASGMLMQQRTLNVLSNNISNVRTPGFRAERVTSTTFEQELLTRLERGNNAFIGSGSPIRVVDDVVTLFDSNFLEKTDRPYDVAINGEGFFRIQGADRQFLTRNGNFDIDEEGYLVLKGVGRVLGENGPLYIESSGFTIKEDGSVYDKNNAFIDTLSVVMPQQGAKMLKFENGLFTTEAAVRDVDLGNTKILQGTIERSNVDLNREFTLVMEAQRTFQSCGNALKSVDQLNSKTVNELAKL